MKTLRTLHAWIGAVLGLILMVVALGGVVSVFRGEVIRATVPAARQAAPDSRTYGGALATFEAAEPGRLQSVKFSPYGLGVHRLYLRGGQGGFVDADGRMVERFRKPPRFEEVALGLHHELLAGEKGGKVVGAAGLLGLAMLVTGLVLWFPARRLFALRAWPRSASRRDLVGTHRDLGVVLSILLLVQMATGAGIVFEPQLRKLLHVAADPPAPSAAAAEGAPDWPRLLVAAQTVFPDAHIRRAAAPFGSGGVYTVSLQGAGDLNPEGGSRVYLDAKGTILGSLDIRTRPAANQLVNALLGVHSGAYAGLPSRLLLAATGLGLILLSGFGVYSFAVKPRGAKRRKDARAPA